MTNRPENLKPQRDRLVETARALDVDEDEGVLKAKLTVIAWQNQLKVAKLDQTTK